MVSMALARTVLINLATSARLEQVVRTVPRGEQLAWRAASRYVAGSTAEDAFRVSRELHSRGVASSIDLFGESIQDPSVAGSIGADYVQLADQLAAQPEDVWLSIDLSHLGLDVDGRRCAERLAEVAVRLPAGRRIQVGAEDVARAEPVLECVLAAAEKGLADRLGATVQANLHRAAGDMERLIAAGIHIRLVKGAYVEPRQHALSHGEPTDVAYVHLAHRLAQGQANFSLATHDVVLREALLTALGPRPVEQLLGVRPAELDDLAARGIPVRVYVPYGTNWFRYWMRRVAESQGS